MRRNLVVIGTMIWMLGCASDVPVAEGETPLAVKASALSTCAGQSADPFTDINGFEVVVRRLSGVLAGENPITFKKKFSGGVSESLNVGGVPEGFDEEVSVLGYAGNEEPSWFARAKNVVIEQGKANPVDLVLSRFGGYSCPKPDTEFTHRAFPTVTDLGGGQFFITGGFTALNTIAGISFVTNQAARRAFVYDANTGIMNKVGSEMSEERGAHSAVLVRGTDKNRVVLFGGARALNYNPGAGNGFAWSFEVKDAVPTVDVFEYDVGGNPIQGQFRLDTQGTALRQKRVFATADVISTDGLVLICGGGQWGVENKPEEYKECEVWDTPANAFLTLSNNDMNIYRAGLSSVLIQSGQVVKILYYGGNSSGELGEVYTSSSSQKDGVGGSFVKTYIEGPKQSFFQSLTAIGGNKFVALGGVNWNNSTATFDKPSAENAWMLKYHDVEGTPAIIATPISGLTQGRYFHVAHAPSYNLLTTLGGFTGNDLNPTPDVRFLTKVGPGEVDYELHPPSFTEEIMQARGGAGSILLDNDTILMVGGLAKITDFGGCQCDAAKKVCVPLSGSPTSEPKACGSDADCNHCEDCKSCSPTGTGSFEVYTPSVLYDSEGGVQ